MLNKKQKFGVLAGISTLVVFSITYAYTSVSDSLNYLKSAGDTGHVGYILTEIFGTDDKIDQKYLDLPSSLSLNNASTTTTGIVMLENSTGSTRQDTAPTSNILKQTWDSLLSAINLKAPIISPSLSGNPTSTTPNNGDVSNKIATTAFVESRVASAAGGTSSNGKYQISCAWNNYSSKMQCCRIDTETGETKCKYSGDFYMTSWNDGTNPWGPENNTISGTGVGYFVLTNSTYNGDLGGLEGANAKCLADLQANVWLGKTNAGTLSSSNVRAWLCDPFTCQNLNGSKVYSFAKSGYATTGGAKFIVDSSSRGPGNNISWHTSTYFGSYYYYWSNRRQYSNNADYWDTYPQNSDLQNTCDSWTYGVGGKNGAIGNSDGTSSQTHRYNYGTYNCSNTANLICIVN